MPNEWLDFLRSIWAGFKLGLCIAALSAALGLALALLVTIPVFWPQ